MGDFGWGGPGMQARTGFWEDEFFCELIRVSLVDLAQLRGVR